MRRGLGFHARHSPGLRFSPEVLFTGGVQGAWFDPSDATTLFSDRAGTTPCAAPGAGALVPVGLMLDKSQNGVGTNGAKRVNLLTYTEQFDNGVWAKTGFNVTANAALAPDGTQTADLLTPTSPATTSFVIQSIAATSGQLRLSYYAKQNTGRYFVIVRGPYANLDYAVFDLQSGTVTLQPVFAGSSAVISPENNGYYRCTLISSQSTGTQAFSISDSASGLGSGTGGSVFLWGADLRLASEAATLPTYQRITDTWYATEAGNHAIAANDTTARPELSARVNLVEYSEQLDNAYWTKDGFTATNTTATTDPLGGTTADICTPTATNSVHRIYRGGTSQVTAPSCVYTLSVKANGYTKIGIRESTTSGAGAAFDLSGSGSVIGAFNAGGSTVSNMSISSQGNGWFRIALTISFASATAQSFGIHALSPSYSAGSTIFEGWNANGTDGYYIWGADLRPTNIGTTIPAYQRVADQYTYNTVGFPRYLAANGTSSAMSTPANVNLSGTDKATVFAGVRALQSAVQVISELSADTNSNNSSFVLYKNNDGLGFASRGTSLVNVNNASGFVPPVSLVLTGQSNITAPSLSLRSNGTQILSSTSSQGTGNFGSYPLFIGARNNSLSLLNGSIYSLIVAGSAVSAGNITATEQWINAKAGGVY